MPTWITQKPIENSNGTFTGFQRIPVEPPRQDPAADRIPYADVLRRFQWTPETFEYAQALGFPKSTGVKYAQSAGVVRGREPVYSQTEITAWQQRLTGFVNALPRLKYK